jgi:hypothetical protein
MNLRNKFKKQITKGKFIPLKTENKEIFAYERILDKKSVVVIINRNLVNSNDINIKIKNFKKNSKTNFIKEGSDVNIVNSRILGKLKPAEIIVFTVE